MLPPPTLKNAQTLVLNANMTPLSWAPLSVCDWRDAFVAVMLERVIQVKTYDDLIAHSANDWFEVPSVVALTSYRHRRTVPFTRYNVFLRDEFQCQYCGEYFSPNELTFDHVFPRSRGGKVSFENISSACAQCNHRKGSLTLGEAKMKLIRAPYRPTPEQIDEKGRRLSKAHLALHQSWQDFLYWDVELET
jgi:5-methylcytosine-specific restriction endonuclease McrA